MLLIKKEDNFSQIDIYYEENFSYVEIQNFIDNLVSKYKKEDILFYLLQQIKNNPTVGFIKHFYPICLMGREFVSEYADKIIENIPSSYFQLLKKETFNESLILFELFAIKKIIKYKDFSYSELLNNLKELNPYVDILKQSEEIEDLIINIIKYVTFNFVEETEQSELFRLLFNYKNDIYFTKWQEIIIGFYTTYNVGRNWTEVINLSLTRDTCSKIINYFNNLDSLSSKDNTCLFSIMNTLINNFEEKIDFHHWFKLIGDYNMPMLGHTLDQLQTKLDLTTFKKEYCDKVWDSFSSGNILNSSCYQYLVKFRKNCSFDYLDSYVFEYLKEKENVFMNSNDYNTLSERDPDEKKIIINIQWYLYEFILFYANNNEEAFKFVENVILYSKNKEMVNYICNNLDLIKNHHSIVSNKLSQLLFSPIERIPVSYSEDIISWLKYFDIEQHKMFIDRVMKLPDTKITDFMSQIIMELYRSNSCKM